MSLKKLVLLASLSVISVTSLAKYDVIYPNVPVHFKNLGLWVQSEPLYSNWINIGNPYDCTSANPLEDTQSLGLTYSKTFYGCKQSQERTLTTSEQHTVSGEVRNSFVSKENQILNNITYTKDSVGTKIVKDCQFSHGGPTGSNRWYDIATTDGYTKTYGIGIDWNGVKKIDTANKKTTYPKVSNFIADGYVYTRGAAKPKGEYFEKTYYYYYYEICREPVAK